MKKLIIILVVLVAICSLMYISVCNDRSGCICSILTTEDSKHPITSILESVWDPDSASEGTFTRLLTTCKHGKRVSLTVFTDEGYFVGRIMKQFPQQLDETESGMCMLSCICYEQIREPAVCTAGSLVLISMCFFLPVTRQTGWPQSYASMLNATRTV